MHIPTLMVHDHLLNRRISRCRAEQRRSGRPPLSFKLCLQSSYLCLVLEHHQFCSGQLQPGVLLSRQPLPFGGSQQFRICSDLDRVRDVLFLMNRSLTDCSDIRDITMLRPLAASRRGAM